MFGLFGDKKTKLEKKYARLLQESYELSHHNRQQSDQKMAEANAVLEQIEVLEREANSTCD